MRLIDLLKAAGEIALAEQRADGSMPPGHNGPHNATETPVRNTGHWLVSFAQLYRWTGEEKWRDAVQRAAGYLTSPAARPHGYTFHHREHPGKDRCNGLIGAAWTFEALVAAADALQDVRFLELAEDVFFQHPFDDARGLWWIVEIDGRVLRFDPTFNHQLWFAAAAALIRGPRRDNVLVRVGRFLDQCGLNVVLLPGGMIYHPIPPIRLATSGWGRIRVRLKEFLKATPIPGISGRVKRTRVDLMIKSIGYHAFNLHAFGMLKSEVPDHPVWEASWLRQAVELLKKRTFVAALEDNPYGYPYNPPGFEVPFALSMLGGLGPAQLLESAGEWIERQLAHTFDPESFQLSRNNPDPRTLTARLYEAARLPDELLAGVDVSAALETVARS